MKVLRRSESELVIEDRPWAMAALSAVLFLAFAAAILGAMRDGPWAGVFFGAVALSWLLWRTQSEAARVRLTLDRAAGEVTIHRHRLWGERRECYPLASLTDVFVERRLHDHDRDVRLALRFRGEAQPRPVTRRYLIYDGGRTATCAAVARAWLAEGIARPGSAA